MCRALLSACTTSAGFGRRAQLSDKFIGEVKRGEKSISIDSLVRLARALDRGSGRVDIGVVTVRVTKGSRHRPPAVRLKESDEARTLPP